VTNNQDTSSFEQVSLPLGTALDAESTGSTKRRFTSYDRSTVTGLDYAVNRHYDPLQGRFTQVDPIGMASTSLSNPQTLNLYAYCTNDPINHTDPSGLGFFSFLGKIFGAIGKFFHSVAKVFAVVAVVLAVVFLALSMPGFVVAFAVMSGLLFAQAYGPPIVGRLLNAIGAAALQVRAPVIAGTPPINPNGGSGIGPVSSFLQGESRRSGPTIAFAPRYQNLIQLFKNAFDNAVNRLKSKKECAKLFGGLQKALNTLNSATYRLFDEPPSLMYQNGKWVPQVTGAATYPGNMVTINISGPFFNGPDLKMSGNRSFRADLGTGLKGNDLAALLLLHELGHQVGKWGKDAGVGDRDANLEHSKKVDEACF
jgi:RHS repeat-associated protein